MLECMAGHMGRCPADGATGTASLNTLDKTRVPWDRQAACCQTANFLASLSGRKESYSSKGWWIHGLVGSRSQK